MNYKIKLNIENYKIQIFHIYFIFNIYYILIHICFVWNLQKTICIIINIDAHDFFHRDSLDGIITV